MVSRLPVTVVTGFLGAGKTTLVNTWLAEVTKGDVAVIVNEHGELGIDGDLLRERARTLVEISGGCICCTTNGELVRALDQLATAEPRPARVLIETSGAASPAGVLRALAAGKSRDSFELDGIVTVVDASRSATFERPLAREQLGYADIVVMSHCDRLDEISLGEVVTRLESMNGLAVLARAVRGRLRVPADATFHELLDLRRDRLRSARFHVGETGAHEDEYQSLSFVIDGELEGDRFADFVEEELARYSGRLFRTKGILALIGMDERVVVQGVGDSLEMDFGPPWGLVERTSRLVVIGFALDEGRLRRAFEACRSPL